MTTPATPRRRIIEEHDDPKDDLDITDAHDALLAALQAADALIKDHYSGNPNKWPDTGRTNEVLAQIASVLRDLRPEPDPQPVRPDPGWPGVLP